ncbi:MAG: hypothetical protein OQK35_07395 [Alphaproteobacteria bacterium]|nr:hypothetical protein [Rhodospirillales bacterium]MCW9046142.1 hypothetical protein [Alphaproteobacteria bacterium]
MNALKGLVIGMGLLIVAGMALLVWGLYQKAQNPDFKFFDLTGDGKTKIEFATTAPTPPIAQNNESLQDFGRKTIPLEAGDKLISVTPASQRLVLHIKKTSGQHELVIVNMFTGDILGTLNLKTAP